MSESIQWTGENLDAVRAFVRNRYGCEFPLDWIEDSPHGALFIMANDVLLLVNRWSRIHWNETLGIPFVI